jgi:hypothetical protein
MDSAEEWRRLCALLDDDETVWDDVETALRDGEDPWDALLGGLDDAGALAYLQADDTGMELSDALVQLPRVYALQPDLGAATDTDDLVAAVRLADAALSAGGFRLLRLVEDDEDSWPLVAVRAASVGDAQALSATLGHEAVPA